MKEVYIFHIIACVLIFIGIMTMIIFPPRKCSSKESFNVGDEWGWNESSKKLSNPTSFLNGWSTEMPSNPMKDSPKTITNDLMKTDQLVYMEEVM